MDQDDESPRTAQMRAARGPARGWGWGRGRGVWRGPRGAGLPPLTLELALSRPPPSHCPGERQPWGRAGEWAQRPPRGARAQTPDSRLIRTQGRVGFLEGPWKGTVTSLPREPLPSQGGSGDSRVWGRLPTGLIRASAPFPLAPRVAKETTSSLSESMYVCVAGK